jgi:hypothetical protein
MAAVIGAALCACERPDAVRHYTERVTVAPAPPAAVPLEPGPAEKPRAATPLAWETPEGWEEKPGGGMRLASFVVGEGDQAADCSIISLAGDAGGLQGNVARWMGQLDIAVPPEDAFARFLSEQRTFATAGGHEGVLVDLSTLAQGDAAASTTMFAGVVKRRGKTIFVKLMGDRDVLEAERGRFLSLCTSLR